MNKLLEEKDKISNSKSNKIFNTETMLPISEIRWNSIILKDWWLRAIIQVSWLNLDLRNYEEQEVIIEQYKRFLNWLDFPIQILVRNTYLDLTDYITYLKDNVSDDYSQQLKFQWDKYVRFIEDINSNQWLLYTKEFYIVVPYYPLEDDKKYVSKSWLKKLIDSMEKTDSPDKVVWRYRSFLKNRKFLDTRANIVMEWLKWVWIISERLEVTDIVSLLFKVYNPTAHKSQSE
jgi:hypothetical protein